MANKAKNSAIRQTELQRLQDQMVGGSSDKPEAKKSVPDAKSRMMKGARNACGPLNKRDWRWAGN